MTAKRKPKHPKNDDPEQSRRFLEAAKAIEADGGLSPIEAEAEMERAVKRLTRRDRAATN